MLDQKKIEEFQRIFTQMRILIIQEISEKCRERGISLLIYKGVALSIQLYNDELYRKSGDIDCVIKREQLKDFLSLIKDLGFKYSKNNTEIQPEFSEAYILYPHIMPFYKKLTNNFRVMLEVHLTTMTGPADYVSYVDLFKDPVELTLANGYTIYTLSYVNNFLSLINHYLRHTLLLINDDMIQNSFEHIHDTRYLEEVYLFFKKYKELIPINELINAAVCSDNVEGVMVANRHFIDLYQTEICPMEKLEAVCNSSKCLVTQLYHYVAGISVDELMNIKEEELVKRFRKTVRFNPTKVFSLNAGDRFAEKVVFTHDGHTLNRYLYPEYTVYYDGKDLIFTITFDKKYFHYDSMSFYFSTQRDDNYVYNRAIYYIYPDGEKWFGTCEEVITERNLKIYPDHYEVTLRCGNVNAKIFRYSLEIRNNINEHTFIMDRVLTCNTLDCLDMTKYCEIHLHDGDHAPV